MTMRPVSSGERIEVLDALRGAALFGIIAANMRGLTGPLAAYFDHTVMWTDPVSRTAQVFVDLFIQGKFITLFAFMFGIGFAIQMERADRSGVVSRMFYVRRLAILLLFGIVHFVFIWWGDILAPYAILAQVVLSVWWLRHFAMGPMEWLWRRLTHGPKPVLASPLMAGSV